MITVSAPQVLRDGVLAGSGSVVVDGERIAAVLEAGPPPDAPDHVRLSSGVLTPGLIDLQSNGAFGVDFARAAPDDYGRVLRAYAARGVTSVQPTFVTAPLAELRAATARCAAMERERPPDGTRVLGAHLEGPFINPARRGAHPHEWILDPTEQRVGELLAGVAPRTITLAPELPGALAAITRLSAHGVVVAVGHADATHRQVRQAADAGATMVTHIFNAQRPLYHREPGVPGAALSDPRLLVGLVVDGHHVHPDVCRLVFAAAPGRVVAVTDSILTAGLPPHTSLMFGGSPVANDEAGVGRRLDGTLAGTGIALDEGLRRMMAGGIEPAAALTACTETPARAIGRDDLGRLQVGALADLVWWDEFYQPQRIWIGGRELTHGGGRPLRLSQA